MKAVREVFLLISLILLPIAAFGQSGASQPMVTPSPPATPGAGFGKHLVRDEKAIWSSPFHLKRDDAHWLVPLAATTAGLIIADRRTSDFVDRNGSLLPVSHKVALLGSAYGVIGTTVGFYLVGRVSHDEHAVQTGKLMGEALIGTTVVTQVLKLAFERSRPNYGTGRGRFLRTAIPFRPVILPARGPRPPCSRCNTNVILG
jgi:hypothetical protein